MDDSHDRPHGGPPLQGPHWHSVRTEELPADFRPLRLVLHPGGQAVDLERPIVLLGRHSEADVRLPLPDVSRRHCRFTFADGAWCVADLNSLNGTFVNDERILSVGLKPGDTLRVGGFTFIVHVLEVQRSGRREEQAAREGVLRSIAEALPPLPREGSNPARRAS